ncbi:UbiA prenyltransferase [Neolentinus lepideus HHB14362 ss-1]|uniref:UbiA prenyltransferase n=1 Tax=Neolentinus lepideus HHB14362 ss-1 TaxID=1314782 RepID=A0A165QVS2_9AGAM|nr:UbiA prenyltransferase [Neolentinus lepideus HHB14362 ss-1]
MASDSKAQENQPLINGSMKPKVSQPWWCGYWELARMHKFPAGSMLIFWPCAWGYIMALQDICPEPLQLAYIMAVFSAGSTLLHCTACTINDICNRDLDAQVECCKNRPLVAGTISMFGAWVFLFLQVTVFFWGLSFVPRNVLICSAFGVFPLHAFYPLMKHVTNWPQAWLSLAMNWGLPTTWLIAAPNDYQYLPMWALTFRTLCWTIVYDTIYMCPDCKDNSTAILFGDYVKPILLAFMVIFIASLIYSGHATGQGWVYYTVSVGGCTVHLVWQLVTLDMEDLQDCWNKFDSNGQLGYILIAGQLGGWYIH